MEFSFVYGKRKYFYDFLIISSYLLDFYCAHARLTIACILKAHSHSHLSDIPVRCTQEGLKCEYEWSLSDMLYSLREHSSSINIV